MQKATLLKAVWEQARIWFCFIVLLILLSLLLYFYQSQFVGSETERLLQRRLSLQGQVKDRQEKLAESGVPVSAVEQLESELQRFSGLIPPKQKFSNFVGDLFSWAAQCQLEIRQVNYRPEIDDETEYLNYGVSFAVQGSYQQLKKFIHLLENSSRILIIDTITLGGRQKTDANDNVTLQIRLTTFFREGK